MFLTPSIQPHLLHYTRRRGEVGGGHLVPELVEVIGKCGGGGMKLDVLGVVVREDHAFVLE